MDSKERMKHAKSRFYYGGDEFNLTQKERLIAIFCDEDRLRQDSYVSWYLMLPSRIADSEWVDEIAGPDRHTICMINEEVWFEEEHKKDFMEWFEQLQNRLDDYKNTIPSLWKNNSDYFDKELDSEDIDRWHDILINSSEYRFAKGVYKFMVEN